MINVKRVIEAAKQTKRKILIILLILVIVIIGLLLLIGNLSKSYLKEAVFFYKGDGKETKLFYAKNGSEPKYLSTLPSEEIDVGKYQVPKYGFVSHDGRILIYFERVEQIPINLSPNEEQLVAYRIIYKPKSVNLVTGTVKDIENELDTTGVVFSQNDREIAWVKRVKESTIEELETANRKREVWISNFDGTNPRRLATLDEKVVVLQRRQGDYIYFWGIKGAGFYSLGRINVKDGKAEYIRPKYCLENLTNCSNFQFSSSGELFIYEARTTKEGEEINELFVERFNGEKSWQILVKNYVSDRLWMPDENSIIYTEQVTPIAKPLQEKIHLVDLKTSKDREIYSGNYVSQLILDSSGNYLYFIEKETDQKFNLTRLDIKTGKTKIIDSGQYSQLKIFSGN